MRIRNFKCILKERKYCCLYNNMKNAKGSHIHFKFIRIISTLVSDYLYVETAICQVILFSCFVQYKQKALNNHIIILYRDETSKSLPSICIHCDEIRRICCISRQNKIEDLCLCGLISFAITISQIYCRVKKFARFSYFPFDFRTTQ